MARINWSTIAVMFTLLVASIPMFVDEVEAGEPIFMANTLVNWEEELRTYDQSPSDMICTADGRIYISYTSGLEYIPRSAQISYSDDSGSTWSRSFRIDDCLRDGNFSNDDTSQALPRLAEAKNGTIYCVWQDNRDYTHTQQIRIAWTTDGENFTRSIKVDPKKKYPTMDAQNPSIAINDEGRILVAWEDRNESGSYWNIYSSYSDDGGVTWSEMVRINSDSMYSRQHTFTALAMKDNDVYVTWQDNRIDGQFRPYMAISHNGGASYGSDFPLSNDLELYNSRQWASPAVDDAGNLYVAWRDKRSGFDEIWFVSSNDNGNTFSDNSKIITVPEGADDWYPSLAATGDGIVSVAFQRRVPTKDSKDEGEIFFINSTDGGETWHKLMRVDDTDMRWEDFTVQRKPILAYDNFNRAIVTWTDERNSDRNNYYSDVWFSRHSGDLSGPNHEPVIYDMTFMSDFEFNRNVGSAVSPFMFSLNYSDEDNDRPIAGYPRLHVFNDSAGTDPLIDPVPMIKAEPRDIDYINGALYKVNLSLPSEGGQLYYRFEVVEERDPDSIFSPIEAGPIIDANPPRITVESPLAMDWINSNYVRCEILVEELEGAHVVPKSIKIRKSIAGPDNFDKGIPITDLTKIDNNTYRGQISIRLEDGKENYIQFETKDRVRNLGLSEPMNIWIDTMSPYYTGIKPSSTQMYESVNCSIDWMDKYPGSTLPSTGVDLSSIMYSYKKTSDDYSEWMKPDGIINLSGGAYRSFVNLDFENDGIYNRIRWKATDNIGNTRQTDDDPDHPNGGLDIRINVKVPDNYPPVFTGSAFPSMISSPTPHFYWDDAFDEEGDDLYYRVMVLKNGLQWIKWVSLGQRTFFDIPSTSRLDPDWYILRINVTDNIGGYDLYDHSFRIIDGGTPPPEDIPVSNEMYTRENDFTVTWEDTPSWALMNITYWIRIGTYEWGGDILDWTSVGNDPEYSIASLDLPEGIYSIQYMAENNGNYSRVSMSNLKISDYEIAIKTPDETFRSFRGKGDGIRVDLINLGTYADNVTVEISGEIVDKEWAYLEVDRFTVESDKDLTIPTPEPVMITIFPEKEAKKGTYTITLKVTSEDGETVMIVDNITVKITDKQTEGIGDEITDTLYGMITDFFPFLEPLSPNLVTGLFFLFILIIVTIIAALGISIYRRSKARTDEDPYAEQRKLYKELYGEEPTMEQLKEMKEGSIVDEVMGVSKEKENKGSDGQGFDESFLEAEKTTKDIEE